MNFHYEELFRVEFRHRYFSGDGLFAGLKVSPAAETQKIMLDNQMLFKPYGTGFLVAYETAPGSRQKNREALLQTRVMLKFRIDLLDSNFYNYTAGIPPVISNLVFHFWNYNSVDSVYRPGGKLQQDDLISGADMNDIRLWAQIKEHVSRKMIAEGADISNSVIFDKMFAKALNEGIFREKQYQGNITLLDSYFSKPFGQISIRLNPDPAYDFNQKFILQFDALSTYRQYILRSPHFQSLKNPAIVDNTNQPVFEEPVPVGLPGGITALSIVSKKSIPLSNKPMRNFRLVSDFDVQNSSFRELNPPMILPDADVNLISGRIGTDEHNEEKKISTIIL